MTAMADGAFVDHDEGAAVLCCGCAGGSAAGEEVEHRVAGVGVDAHDSLEDS